MDARFDTTLANMRICNEPPTLGNLGVSGAMHLVPGNNATSLIWLRMTRRDDDGMPPLASALVDTLGAQRLEEWIDGIASCPAPTGPAPCLVPENDIQNCNMDAGTQFWQVRGNGGNAALSVVGGELRIDILQTLDDSWEPQVVQSLGSVTAGNYEIEFSARAAAPRTMVVNLGQDADPWLSRCGGDHVVNLTTTTQHFSITCNGVIAEPAMKLDFNVGDAGTAAVFIDNVYFGVPR